MADKPILGTCGLDDKPHELKPDACIGWSPTPEPPRPAFQKRGELGSLSCQCPACRAWRGEPVVTEPDVEARLKEVERRWISSASWSDWAASAALAFERGRDDVRSILFLVRTLQAQVRAAQAELTRRVGWTEDWQEEHDARVKAEAGRASAYESYENCSRTLLTVVDQRDKALADLATARERIADLEAQVGMARAIAVEQDRDLAAARDRVERERIEHDRLLEELNAARAVVEAADKLFSDDGGVHAWWPLHMEGKIFAVRNALARLAESVPHRGEGPGGTA